jgi:predicted ribosomally synthesized peptide with SipW-like signal peptide
MKKFLILTLATMLALSMIGGAFAYFSDTETSTGNTFTAGTLDLTYTVEGSTGYSGWSSVEMDDSSGTHVVFSNISPGDSGKIDWYVTNDGTIDGSLDMTFVRINDNDNAFTEPEDLVYGGIDNDDGTPDGDLDRYMHVRLQADLNHDTIFTPDEFLQNGTEMGQLEAYDSPVELLSDYDLSPGETLWIQFAWRIQSDIPGVDDNIIQSDSFELVLDFELLQVAD